MTAHCGVLAFYAKAQTWLMYPRFADRMSGMDVEDIELGQRLGGALWNEFGEKLLQESRRVDEA